jgi:hypothetical protein
VPSPPPGSTVSRLLATSVAASRSSSVVTLICRARSPANDGGSASPRQPPEEWRSWLDTRTKGGGGGRGWWTTGAACRRQRVDYRNIRCWTTVAAEQPAAGTTSCYCWRRSQLGWRS